jgi:hypothetical protein
LTNPGSSTPVESSAVCERSTPAGTVITESGSG